MAVPATTPAPLPPEAHPGMSPADHAHWEQVLRWRARTLPASAAAPEPRAPELLGRARWLLDAGVRLLPALGTGSLARTAVGVAGGLLGDPDRLLDVVGLPSLAARLGELGHELGRRGLDASGVVAAYRRAGHDLSDLGEVAALEVDAVLAARPALAPTYVTVAALAGGALALLPGAGALADRCVTGWPGPGGPVALLGSVAAAGAEAALTAATCSRAVAVTGAWYGFDPEGAGERAVALAVLAVSVADGAAQHHADEVLRVLLAGGSVPAGQAPEVTELLRDRLRLPGPLGALPLDALPLVGAAVAAVVAGRLLGRVLDDADHLYRERFLRERYGAAIESVPVPAAPVPVAAA